MKKLPKAVRKAQKERAAIKAMAPEKQGTVMAKKLKSLKDAPKYKARRNPSFGFGPSPVFHDFAMNLFGAMDRAFGIPPSDAPPVPKPHTEPTDGVIDAQYEVVTDHQFDGADIVVYPPRLIKSKK